MQLTGSGFRQIRSWSAAALREVRAMLRPTHVGELRVSLSLACIHQPPPPPLLQAVQVAPVMVGIWAPAASLFEFYSGGIWPASSCDLPPGRPDLTKAMVNHALLVVGYDMRIPGKEHWIVKNSWGSGQVWVWDKGGHRCHGMRLTPLSSAPAANCIGSSAARPCPAFAFPVQRRVGRQRFRVYCNDARGYIRHLLHVLRALEGRGRGRAGEACAIEYLAASPPLPCSTWLHQLSWCPLGCLLCLSLLAVSRSTSRQDC